MRTGWKVVLILGIILSLGIGIMVGMYTYHKNKTQNSNMVTQKLAQIQEVQENNITENAVISTSIEETRISPNCTIVEKQYFKGCDHLIKEVKEIPEDWVNLTEEQVRVQYEGWNIESFSNNQIIVGREREGFCGQHYVIRQKGEVLAIYTLDENGEESWKEDTDIATKYLPEEDLEKVKEGIKVIGDEKLHTVLGDFE